MAADDLTQAQFAIAFDFARSEAGTYRDASGVAVNGTVNVPRFDHDIEGMPRGLLVMAGYELGGGDRVTIKTAALPEDVFDLLTPQAADVTILHRFAPAVADDGQWREIRRAWYSRNAKAAIDALLASSGHHLEIGLVRGFRRNINGEVRYRDQVWQLAGVLLTGSAALTDGQGRPLIIAGAAKVI